MNLPIILFSSLDLASSNIASELIKFGFEKKENEYKFEDLKLIDEKAERMCNIKANFEADYFVVLSCHRSKANLKSLTVHIPGNWDSADLGGSPRTLNTSYASKQKIFLKKIAEKNKKYNLGFNVTYECDHHGPTIEKPIIFVEIGSSEEELKNPVAGKIIAESVFEGIQDDSSCENFFGIGGGHYAPAFTRLVTEKESDFGFGHILPTYNVNTIEKDTFQQVIEKNIEPVKKILMDKKGLNSEQKTKIEKLADQFGIEIEKI